VQTRIVRGGTQEADDVRVLYNVLSTCGKRGRGKRGGGKRGRGKRRRGKRRRDKRR
jgi:hypothetical protein